MKKKEMPPCARDCDERHPGCHAGCERYQQWRREYDERKNELSERKRQDEILMAFNRDLTRKIWIKTKGKWHN